MLRALLVSLAVLASMLSHSGEATVIVDCAAGIFKQRQLGQLENFTLGKKVTQLAVLQEALDKLAKEADILARIEPLPSEKKGVIEDSLAMLEGNPSKMYSCLFSKVGAEDSIHKFIESEKNETRYGYIVISKGKKVAYFYHAIVVI